jgi:hypothetical protein
MKGQFFIIGGLLVCVLLFFGLGAGISFAGSSTGDMDRLADNLAGELPRALNIGINATDAIGVVHNFTVFSKARAGAGGIGLDCFWLIFQEQGGDVNVSVGNFLGSLKTFSVDIDGSAENIQAADGAVNSSLFSVSGYKFNATITVDGGTAVAEMILNKTSMYFEMSLAREGNLLKKEILA